MTALAHALRAELRKARASRVLTLAGAALVVGVAAITGAMTLDLASTPTLGGAKVDAFSVTDATSYVSTAAQVASVASLLAFGIAAAWIVGREFVDGTVSGLFARPVSLTLVAVAKLTVYFAWCLIVTALVILSSLASILALGFSWPDDETVLALGRLATSLVVTSLLSMAAALVATLARGYLAAFGAIIAMVAVSQIAVIAGLGAWFPLSAPALWAIFGAEGVEWTALAGAGALGSGFALATVASWRRLRLTETS